LFAHPVSECIGIQMCVGWPQSLHFPVSPCWSEAGCNACPRKNIVDTLFCSEFEITHVIPTLL
jgi:hypothetical protein